MRMVRDPRKKMQTSVFLNGMCKKYRIKCCDTPANKLKLYHNNTYKD